jgi:hypothetical protein
MAKRVFFSFHYQDVIDFRANVVRNHWIAKPERSQAGYFDASIWEKARRFGNLKRLINGALDGTSVTCVLVGSQTYVRPWVRYEIVRSIYRGNRTFAVHINGIRCKNQNVKPYGPNPFDYLAVRYSKDGTRVEILEYSGGKWIRYADHAGYQLERAAPEFRRGKAFKLSQLSYPVYCWSRNDGYKNFASWVGD